MKVDKKQMKSAARLYAVQALFQMESSGQTVESVTKEFETHRFGAIYDEEEMAEGDVDHFRAVVDHAVNLQAKIDQMTDRALVAKWPIARIDPVLRALFRAAGAELSAMPTPPAPTRPSAGPTRSTTVAASSGDMAVSYGSRRIATTSSPTSRHMCRSWPARTSLIAKRRRISFCQLTLHGGSARPL